MDGRGPFGDMTNTLNRRKRQSHDHHDNQAVENGKLIDSCDLVITASFQFCTQFINHNIWISS